VWALVAIYFDNMAVNRGSVHASITAMLNKIADPDPDIRFMQLSDLASVLSSPSSEYMRNESHTAARIIDALLKTLTDQNGEVQNQALKW
jgi:cullin-associated NEDD8-dissociated protein 1